MTEQSTPAWSSSIAALCLRTCGVIITAVDSSEPPLHLVLGGPGLKLVRQQLAALQQEFDTWEALSLSADFPEQS